MSVVFKGVMHQNKKKSILIYEYGVLTSELPLTNQWNASFDWGCGGPGCLETAWSMLQYLSTEFNLPQFNKLVMIKLGEFFEWIDEDKNWIIDLEDIKSLVEKFDEFKLGMTQFEQELNQKQALSLMSIVLEKNAAKISEEEESPIQAPRIKLPTDKTSHTFTD